MVYNNTIHSAINLKPNEALLFENIADIKKRQFYNRIEKYKKLFNTKLQRKLQMNDMVLIEDAIHKKKGQKKFFEIGEIIGVLANDTYWVARENKISKRHVRISAFFLPNGQKDALDTLLGKNNVDFIFPPKIIKKNFF